MNSELLVLLAAERQAELRRAAERNAVGAAARLRRGSIRLRLGSITVLIEREAGHPAPRSASRPT